MSTNSTVAYRIVGTSMDFAHYNGYRDAYFGFYIDFSCLVLSVFKKE